MAKTRSKPKTQKSVEPQKPIWEGYPEQTKPMAFDTVTIEVPVAIFGECLPRNICPGIRQPSAKHRFAACAVAYGLKQSGYVLTDGTRINGTTAISTMGPKVERYLLERISDAVEAKREST